MNRTPHFALRGLYRRAGAAISLSARLDETETLAGRLFVELARHPLVAPAVMEQLAIGVDTTTPLQRALLRIARSKLTHPGHPRAPRRDADTAEYVASRATDATAGREKQAAIGSPQRVQDIIRAAKPPSPFALTSEQSQARPRVLRASESSDASMPTVVATSSSSNTTRAPAPAAAREALEEWIRKAGAAADRPVMVSGLAADVIAGLIAGRPVPTATLIEAAVPADSAEQPDRPVISLLQQSTDRLGAVLDRIVARRAATSERLPPDPRTEASNPSSEPAARMDGHATLDHAGVPISGLRRLAMRAGASVRAIDHDTRDEPVSGIRRELSVSAPHPTALPETDDALSRRIADILMREARRHGVETSGVEP